MEIEKIYLASDHGGYEAKKYAKEILKNLGFSPIDLGTDSSQSVDYPDFAKKLSDEVAKSEKNFGVIMCGTGIGISIAANRNPKIRCALCHDTTEASLAREHNNANVLALGGRTTGKLIIEEMIKTFFSTEFSGGRHARRVEKLGNL